MVRWNSTITNGIVQQVNQGAVLIVLNQLFIAMYIFELFYRAKLSPVAVAHHIGAITIAQSAVTMSLKWEHERDATIEFILCFVWGMLHLVEAVVGFRW